MTMTIETQEAEAVEVDGVDVGGIREMIEDVATTEIGIELPRHQRLRLPFRISQPDQRQIGLKMGRPRGLNRLYRRQLLNRTATRL